MERTKMPNLRNGSKGGIWTPAHLIASPVLYRWATALHVMMGGAFNLIWYKSYILILSS